MSVEHVLASSIYQRQHVNLRSRLQTGQRGRLLTMAGAAVMPLSGVFLQVNHEVRPVGSNQSNFSLLVE